MKCQIVSHSAPGQPPYRISYPLRINLRACASLKCSITVTTKPSNGKKDTGRATTRANTFQLKRRDVVGTNGQPQGPHPHVHILPCPYYTQALRAYSPYSRGERGEDVVVGPLWS